MLNHRRHIPIFIALNVWGLFGALVFPVLFDRPTSVMVIAFSALAGLLAGVGIGRKCVSWIANNESNGNIFFHLWGRGPLTVIGIFFLLLGLMALGVFIKNGWIPTSLLSLFVFKNYEVFKGLVSVFMSTIILVVLVVIYVWGLSYEKKTGKRLMYKLRVN